MTRKPHPLAETVPSMTDEEYRELVADIKKNGLREPITLYQDMILDGRHRYKACNETGVTAKYGLFEGTEAKARAFVISKNYHRRMVTAEKKRERIAELLKAQPEASDREIAKQAKVDHKTVGAVRSKKEATGEIPQLEKRKGRDGKTRNKPKAKAKAETKAEAKAKAEAKEKRDAEKRLFKHLKDSEASVTGVDDVLFSYPEFIDGGMLDQCRNFAKRWTRLVEKFEQARGNGTDPAASAAERKAAA
jgi:ParB-like chromosome segregation protein Spo0J